MDIALTQSDDGVFDIGIQGGDLLTDSGMRTAVLLSLFSDRIAQDDDVIPDGTDNRRGYWADAYDASGDRIGSRLWVLSREMQTVATLSRAEEYANEALQWMVDDSVAKTVSSTANWLDGGVLCLQTAIVRSDNSLYEETFNFSLETL